MCPVYFIQHPCQSDTLSRGKLVQQAQWVNEIAVEEHKHVAIKLASDSDSSSEVFGLRAYEISLY